MQIAIGTTTLSAEQGDLTALTVDAIVNAANRHLKHGGGLAAAIVGAGGEVIQRDSDRWIEEHGPLSPGTAAITTAGVMPCQSVIHVAGPTYRDGQDNESLLRTAVGAALEAAAAGEYGSIALPAISAGIFGYPMHEATRVIAAEVVSWARAHPDALHRISLVGFNEEIAAAFAAGLDVAR